MVGALRSCALATALVAASAAPAAAGPTWLASANISTAPLTGTPTDPVVASDAAGETFAA